MVIITDKCGRLANRLFLFAYFIANAIEFNYRICYPVFSDYAHYFQGTTNDILCRYPPTPSFGILNSKARRLVCFLLFACTACIAKFNFTLFRVVTLDIRSREDSDGDFELSDAGFIETREASRLLFAKGWLFRDGRNLRNHAEQVRVFFRPAARHAAVVGRLMDQARKDCDILVGIHMRQGDYQNWLGGRYFYTTEQYAGIIRRSRGLWGDRRVRYLICSNTKQDERSLAGLDYLLAGNNEVEDLYALACCDYLIGPPSTYSMWASFYGSVPLLQVEEPEQALALENFAIIEG